MGSRPLLELPYDQRRMVVVMQPQAVAEDRSASIGRWALVRVAGAASASAASASTARATGLGVAAKSLPLLAALVAPAVIKAVYSFREQARRRGLNEELLVISPEQARTLNFPIGHPQKKLVYIGHPVDPTVYIPFAQFHSFLFEHKVAEALRLVRTLGAETVTTVRVAGWRQTAGVHVDVPVPKTTIGAGANQHRDSESYIETTMTLNPTAEPYLPKDLVWFPHEPLWRELADARLEAGLSAFEVEVRSSDDYGINASLKVMVEKAGLDIGGDFVKHETTLWKLKGTFKAAATKVQV